MNFPFWYKYKDTRIDKLCNIYQENFENIEEFTKKYKITSKIHSQDKFLHKRFSNFHQLRIHSQSLNITDNCAIISALNSYKDVNKKSYIPNSRKNSINFPSIINKNDYYSKLISQSKIVR